MPSSWAAERDSFRGLTDGGRIRHQPGLDGLRGLAVAAVVVFHTGLGWLPGGYLGVSLFFTISGVVIGTVILHEIATPGGFALRSFWARRARRLLPAAWLVLAAVAVLRVTTTVLASTRASDVVASFLQVANWHFLAEDASYGTLFSGPSAVLHFWSLAIEEQFYLVIGAGAVALARWSRQPVRDLAIGASGLAAVSFALPFVFAMSVDRTYYGTDTRAGELLVGLAIAALIADRDRRAAMMRWRRPLALAAVVAAAVMLVLWRVLDPGTAGLANGVLPLSALLSCSVIVGALVPGPLRLMTSWRPLRRLGDISYALYLVHWPVFVILRHADPDPTTTSLALATAVAVALAILSTRLVETPVRRRRVAPIWLGAAGVTLVGVIAVALMAPAQRTDADALVERLDDVGDGATTPTPPDDVEPSRTEPVVGIFGDSIGFSLAFSMAHAPADAGFAVGPGEVEMGCGIALAPARTDEDAARCGTLVDRMVATVDEHGMSAALVVSCQWELLEQVLPGDSRARVPGDPIFDAYVRDSYARVANALRDAGAEPLWLRCPEPSQTVAPGDLGADLWDARDPARVAAINAVVDDLGAAGVVRVVDLASWVDPRREDAELRPDGTHFDWDVDTGVAGELTRLIDEALTS